ncbi:MAG TPA: glycine cleavage system aminomethyltransferase GcvT [Stellaceae bacterium]|jgi:aminomethyltransferase|nr:glycine cleavage system aminomethyltransferase GcvT [Stellaceae bacterium]
MAARKHGPYWHQQKALGAEFADRIGFDAAVRYTTTEAEHLATRQAAGLYDVYNQVMVEVRGRDAMKLLRQMLVNDVSRIGDGKVLYSSLCKPDGGMVDDLTCYRHSPTHFQLSPTPSRVDRVLAWLGEHRGDMDAVVTNLGAGLAYLSVQGPASRDILKTLTDADLSSAALPYYSFTHAAVAEVPRVMVSRTGYSGELGFELFYPGEYAEHMWEAVMVAGKPLGLTPCGLGALRTVRMEKRYPLYGLDLDESTSPLEADLGWTVHFNERDFIGREALVRQRAQGVARKLVLIEFADLAAVPAGGDEIRRGTERATIGKVTSAEPGWHLRRALALGYVGAEHARDGTKVEVTLKAKDGARLLGTIRLAAPYDPDRRRARS